MNAANPAQNHLEMRGICKYFGGVHANENINLKVGRGEIHALLGENGAGKSTLMNILYGLYAPTSGDILLDGKKVTIGSPQKAISLGIGMVHQHFMLIPALSVAENMVLGVKSSRSPLFDLKKAAKLTAELCEKYHMQLDPLARVSDLTVGQQQRLEILKALYRGARLLILDEPTAVLTPQEAEELFVMIRRLADQGNTVIFITHKLNEVMSICDRITILRQGQTVATVEKAQTSKSELARLMIGRDLSFNYCRRDIPPASPVLELLEVSCLNRGVEKLKKVTLSVRGGEILGICGVDGNGQSELVDAITGLRPATGVIRICGQDMTGRDTRSILSSGVSHIPADRHRHGVVLGMDLADNVLLTNTCNGEFVRGRLLDRKKLEDHTRRILEKYQVKCPGVHSAMGTLSGGNQQKVVLGRELERTPKLLIAMHPARGLDLGATEYVHEKILEARDNGSAVLLVSTELDEILSLSDRIAVFFEGQIMGTTTPDADVHSLGLMMAGVKSPEGDGPATPPAV